MDVTFEEYCDLHADVVIRQFLVDAKKKNYFKRFDSVGGDDYLPDVVTVQFHLKRVFKPFNTMKDINFDKAGQGISAWSVPLLIAFCVMFRLLAAYDRDTDTKTRQTYVATDNGVNQLEFMRDVAAVMRRLAKWPMRKVIGDGVMYDAMQDEYTQHLEAQYMTYLGAPVDFVEFYFQFRHHMRVRNGVVTVMILFQKMSGEPATLWANGIGVKVVVWCSARGGGMCLFIYKGDDTFKCQAGLEVDEDLLKEFYCHTNLRLKVQVVEKGEFCGMTMIDGLLVPNIHRILAKIVAYRAKTYKDFAEYQKSLRDYEKIFAAIGEENCVLAMCDLKDCSREDAEMVMDAIKSWAHVDEQQWRNATFDFTEAVAIPYMDEWGDLQLLW